MRCPFSLYEVLIAELYLTNGKYLINDRMVNIDKHRLHDIVCTLVLIMP